MGTTWSVKVVSPATPLNRDLVQKQITARLEELEQRFSTYRPNSELSRFNADQSTEWLPVSTELARVAAESRRISELTAGAFDVTVEPLVRLWGFGPQRRTDAVPSDTEIGVTRARVDWRRVEARLKPPALRKTRPDLSLDFSSMAKGFAADAIAEMLDAFGAPDHFVQVGGDIKTGGQAGDGRPWRTGIEQPVDGGGTIACVVNLSGHALSTSGDYRNFFTVGGRRYSHLINPRTGAPADSGVAAVSVVHSSCATSSALATALFVLGPVEGMRVAKREGLACMFFVRDGAAFTRRTTPEFERLIR